jgi:hypothetical protein
MNTVERTGWTGWGYFAAWVLLLDGIFGVLQGVVLLVAHDTYFVARGSLFVFDLSGWGWWCLVVGLIVIGVSIALFVGQTWARVIAVILAVISATGQLLLIPAQPWWSIIIIAVDVLIIYALTAHGRELRD